MDITVEIQGNSVAGYMVRGEREEKLCSAGQAWTVELDLNFPHTVMPWNTIVIYEEGTKTLTGYVASVNYHIGDGDAGITVTGLDTWKLATDGWSTEVYTTNSGDTAKSIMAKYLDAAGLSYSFNDVIDEPMPESATIPYMPFSEILYEIAASVGAYIRVDADGVVQIGHIMDEMENGPDISVGTNIISMRVEEDDAKARNRVIVWGPNDTGDIRTDEDWAIVDHTMVFASPYVRNAGILAAAIHAQLHTLEIIKTINITGTPELRVGQHCNITGPENTWSGEDYCTSVKAFWGKGGYLMTTKFGERCAVYGRGAPVPEADGRDIIIATWKFGVWRCKDIWQDVPHWEPLNTGLDTAYPGYIPENGGMMCDWFIRDPFEPNTRAYLQTKYGIYETLSLEPGEESWTPVPVFLGSPVWKMRSSITHKGRYFVILGPSGNEFGGWSKALFMTDDHFRSFKGKLGGGWQNCQPPEDYEPKGVFTCSIEGPAIPGRPLTGQEENTGLSSWHHQTRYCGAGMGGLAAWHRAGTGCTISAHALALTTSTIYDEPGPAIWHGNLYRMSVIVPTPQGIPTFEWYPQLINKNPEILPMDWYICEHLIYEKKARINRANRVWKHSTIHIPYDQGMSIPPMFYMIPGWWEGDAVHTTAAYPTLVAGAGEFVITDLPWGGDDCHFLQGCLGTYTPDRNKVYCFNAAKPSRFAISDNGSGTWTEKTSVPFKTSCFSGFPHSSQKVYVGRDPVRDETAPYDLFNPYDPNDNHLIYVSWDRGDTWTNVTGDLWDNTKAMGLRHAPEVHGGYQLGAYGLVTIAPRYI